MLPIPPVPPPAPRQPPRQDSFAFAAQEQRMRTDPITIPQVIEHPFQVLDATTGGTAGIRVRFGQVNNVTPLIVTDPISAASAGPILTLSDGVSLIYLHLTVDDPGTITAALVEEDTTLPADDDDESYLVIAQVTVVSDEVTLIEQSVTHSLQFIRCGRVAADAEADPPVVAVAGTPEYWGI